MFDTRNLILSLIVVLPGCAISPKPSEIKELEANAEYEEIIHIKKIEPVANTEQKKEESIKNNNKNILEPVPSKENKGADLPPKSSVGKQPPKKSVDEKKNLAQKEAVILGKGPYDNPSRESENNGKKSTAKREPSIEDSEGFDGRRPIVDPFKVGEVLTYDANYGVISAGKVRLKTHPYVEVNGRKSYYFTTHADSNSVFSLFYKVRDWAETYVDFANLIPYSYALHVRESKQYREAKNFFDWKNLEARYWEKRIRNDKLKEKKLKWEIHPYSQNVISSFFYMRAFQYRVGKKIKFRVADKGKNLTVTLTPLKTEVLNTNAGKFDTIKCEADFTYDGVFKPVGKVFVWFTRDDRRLITKIDAKIKIGTVSLDLEKIEGY